MLKFNFIIILMMIIVTTFLFSDILKADNSTGNDELTTSVEKYEEDDMNDFNETQGLNQAPSNAPTAPGIDYCQVCPSPADSDVTFRYKVSGAASVVVNIYNDSGILLRQLGADAFDGVNDVQWDLCDAEDKAVDNGVYLWKLKAYAGGYTTQISGKIAVLR